MARQFHAVGLQRSTARSDPNSIRAKWCEPIFSVNSFIGMIVGRDLIRLIVGESLNAAAALTTLQTGKDPRVHFASAFSNKKEVHDAMKRATEEAKDFNAASCQLSDEDHAWRLR